MQLYRSHVTHRPPLSHPKKSAPREISPPMGRSLLSGARCFSGFFFPRSSLPPCFRTAFPSPARPRSFATMASAESQIPSVESLSLQSTTQKSPFPGCFPSLNPVDVYREHIATELSKATDIDAEKIYSRLAWTNTLDKGDLTLPVCELYLCLERALLAPYHLNIADRRRSYRSPRLASRRTLKSSPRNWQPSFPNPSSSNLPTRLVPTCSSFSGHSLSPALSSAVS